MTSIDNLVKCPVGTKQWLLFLGYLEADAAWFLRGANISTQSKPNPGPPERRKLVQYAVLIEHPKENQMQRTITHRKIREGLILWETGSGENWPEVWGAPLNDAFARADYHESYELAAQVEATGHKVSDIKMVVIGHLHLDHAGGLHHWYETDVPIPVHELELKNAFYSVATKNDIGLYLPTYVNFKLNWQAWRGDTTEIAQGIVLHHMPGHTPGLCIMQTNLEKSGTWILTMDMYLVKENYTENHAQGFLSRDHDDWCHSNQKVHNLVRSTDAKIVFGHDKETLEQFKMAPEFYD